jgi:hypothetical protein
MIIAESVQDSVKGEPAPSMFARGLRALGTTKDRRGVGVRELARFRMLRRLVRHLEWAAGLDEISIADLQTHDEFDRFNRSGIGLVPTRTCPLLSWASNSAQNVHQAKIVNRGTKQCRRFLPRTMHQSETLT